MMMLPASSRTQWRLEYPLDPGDGQFLLSIHDLLRRCDSNLLYCQPHSYTCFEHLDNLKRAAARSGHWSSHPISSRDSTLKRTTVAGTTSQEQHYNLRLPVNVDSFAHKVTTVNLAHLTDEWAELFPGPNHWKCGPFLSAQLPSNKRQNGGLAVLPSSPFPHGFDRDTYRGRGGMRTPLHENSRDKSKSR